MSSGNAVNCSSPIDVAVLADYWLSLLASSEEEAVEEHLFQCGMCEQRLREMVALGEGVRSLAREGSLRMIVSDTFLKHAAEEGLRVRQYAPPSGGKVECTVTGEDDILIGRLATNLSGAARVDLSICDERGIELLRMKDIPVHSATSAVIYQESITFLKAAPTFTMIARLVTFDESGSEQLIDEYTFNHTRSLPGPAGWQPV